MPDDCRYAMCCQCERIDLDDTCVPWMKNDLSQKKSQIAKMQYQLDALIRVEEKRSFRAWRAGRDPGPALEQIRAQITTMQNDIAIIKKGVERCRSSLALLSL